MHVGQDVMSVTRRGVLVAATALVAVLVFGAAPAIAADYAYWYSLPGQKVMRQTTPPLPIRRASTDQSAPTLYFSAAQDEFEGRQISVRPKSSTYNFRITPSDLVRQSSASQGAVIPASEVSVHWVAYHRITIRSYGQATKVPSYYPDALPPTRLLNGKTIYRSVSGNVTQPFYVLIHVPNGTPAGTYVGKWTITASGAPAVTVPVNLRVWNFSIAKRTLRSSFGFNLRCARWFADAPHRFPIDPDGTQFGGQPLNRWMIFFKEHRIAPASLAPGFWGPNAQGKITVRQQFLDDYAGTGKATTFDGQRLNFNTLPMPDRTFYPSYIANPFSSSAARLKAATYYRSMRSAYGANVSRVLVYAIDEPFARDRARVQAYASLVHTVVPGSKFMTTFDPGRFAFKPVRGIDIYVHKLHFWYRDRYRWILPLKRQGKTFWIYSHTTPWQKEAPLYLIDKPTTDSRVQGWFAYHTAAAGVLSVNVNRWVSAYDRNLWRDPYATPLSVRVRESNGAVQYSNGDASLTYPGYYPRLGLTVPGAGPVSSLRMEALRDGFEDYEYLKLLEQKKGRAYALKFVAGIIKASGYRGMFPDYSKSPYAYQQARDAVARQLELP